MTTYSLSPAANASIDEIFVYTLEQWGPDQARSYLETLFGTFEAIANGLARSRDAKPAFGFEANFVKSGRHYIYWKHLNDGRIGITAIIHESRQQAIRFAEAVELSD